MRMPNWKKRIKIGHTTQISSHIGHESLFIISLWLLLIFNQGKNGI